MAPKKWMKRILMLIIIILISFCVYYSWFSLPIITGYDAKNVCSCVFVEERNKDSVIKEDVAGFPLNIAKIKVDQEDSSVTATVLGMAKRKAIFRKGWGCTLINDVPENVLRNHPFELPDYKINSDSLPWPYGDKVNDSLIKGIDRNKLNEAVNYAFTSVGPDQRNFTRAVLIIYNGQLVAERYAPGYNVHSRMLGWSMTKSIMNTLIAMLIKDGKLDLSAPAPVPQWRDTNDPRHAITLENLMQQTSGLDFREDYTSFSEATNMLFNKGDMASYTAGLPLKYKPGTVFNYSSGNSNIISAIVRRTTGDKEYVTFLYNRLFHKLGMNSAILEPDASGTFVGSSYIFASARDYARFGLLYYNDGIWNGDRMLPEGWVKKTYTPSEANKAKNYGLQFWLNGFNKKDITKRWYPDAPQDMYFADGYGGQDIYIIPSKKLIVIRLGLKGLQDENGYLKKVMNAIKE